MKEFKLGNKVVINKCYQRNGIKPSCNSTNKNRYKLLDLNSIGVWCGKRRIYTEGYTESDYDYGMCFVPVKYEMVHLVAISTQRTVYVPDDFINILE